MSYVAGYGTPSGTKAYWGNGDGRFLYPPEGYDKTTEPILEGPVSSFRWEELREGIEDVELFHLLKDEIESAKKRGASPALIKKAESLVQVPKDVVADPSDYNPDPKPMLAHRSEVGRMIEALKK
jgi:hypothetical protein